MMERRLWQSASTIHQPTKRQQEDLKKKKLNKRKKTGNKSLPRGYFASLGLLEAIIFIPLFERYFPVIGNYVGGEHRYFPISKGGPPFVSSGEIGQITVDQLLLSDCTCVGH